MRLRARTDQSDEVKQRWIPISNPQGRMLGGPVLALEFFGLDVLERRPDFAHPLPRDADLIVFRDVLYEIADCVGGGGSVREPVEICPIGYWDIYPLACPAALSLRGQAARPQIRPKGSVRVHAVNDEWGKHESGSFIDNGGDVPNRRRIERLQFPAFLVLRPGSVRFRKRRTDPVGRSTTGFDPNRAHGRRITLDDPDEGHKQRPLVFSQRVEI